MPIYEYQCTKCGHEFEVMQKFSDKPVSKCPECTGEVKKVISNTSFVLKGSGWYADGYASPAAKKSGAKKDAKADTKAKKSGGNGSSGATKSGTKEKAAS
jgi:putative FmdB family regulatory protein